MEIQPHHRNSRFGGDSIMSIMKIDGLGNLKTSTEIIEYPEILSGVRNLTTFDDPQIWGLSNITKRNGYYDVVANTDAAAWGLVTDRGIGLNLLGGQEYTLSFDMLSDNLDTLRYCYIISSSGNQKINNIVVNKPTVWTRFSTTVTPATDRLNAGILIGGDRRGEPTGASYSIKNLKIEKGSLPSIFTPSPESLGLNYPSWIENFKPCYSNKGVLIGEIDETKVCAFEDFFQYNNWADSDYIPTRSVINSFNNGILNITSQDGDPWFTMYNIGKFNPLVYRYLEFRYRVVSGTTNDYEIFFTNDLFSSATGQQRVGVAESSEKYIEDGNWYTVYLDMWKHPNWKTGGNITGWRWDWCRGLCTMEFSHIRLVSEKDVLLKLNSSELQTKGFLEEV